MEPAETLWDALLKYYTEAEAQLWLTLPHPQLEGQVPAILCAQGNSEPVWQVLDRLEADGYI